jgi:hypothetical protein
LALSLDKAGSASYYLSQTFEKFQTLQMMSTYCLQRFAACDGDAGEEGLHGGSGRCTFVPRRHAAGVLTFVLIKLSDANVHRRHQ